MLSRLKYCAIAFASIVAVYILYALIAVPLIEPSPKLISSKRTTARPRARVRKFDHLFPKGSWELDRPKVVETDHGTLLFDDYKPLPDGRLELTRCTVIAYTGNADSDSNRREVVLRAVNGATLTFDRKLNIIRGEFGRLVGGVLEGEISITSPPSEPGRDDAIEILTRNVQLDAKRIWTPHDVKFRYGPNRGSGRDLTIFLQPQAETTEGKPSFGVGGLRSLELNQLHQMELQLNDSGLFGAAKVTRPTGIAGSPTKPIDDGQPSSALVRCRGPLRFDLDQQILSLEDHVDLARHNPNGPSDQLSCQLLEIHFAQAEEKSSAEKGAVPAKDKKSPTKLTPTKVIALGYPVTIQAASVGVKTWAERIEYDCILRRVWLKDRDKVMLQDREREVEAKEIGYTLGEKGRIGDLTATGPGILRASVGTPARTMELTWQGFVAIRRIEGNPVLSFNSIAQVSLPDTGVFSAETLHLYLKETAQPQASGPPKIVVEPDRLHALGNVTLHSANLSGEVEEAKLWFRKTANSRPQAGEKPGGQLNPLAPFGPGKESQKERKQKFRLTAKIIEGLILMGDSPVADRLVVRGNLELREVTTGEQQPLVIRGDLFELQEGASEHPRGALLGAPAEVVARGMTAHGNKFHMYPNDNVLDIVGAGDMILPMKSASPMARDANAPARISWQDQMHFDGLMASFNGKVNVNIAERKEDGTTRGVAMGDNLHVSLSERIDFQRAQESPQVELHELAFDGWSFFEVHMTDNAGERKMTQQMQVRQLTINQRSGEISGEGPGWVRGIHRGDPRQTTGGNRLSLPTAQGGLHFLRVDFQRTLAGNIHRRQLEFLHGTKTLYGPVASWDDALDQADAGNLPPDAVVLTCDRLAVAQTVGAQQSDDVELEATGNAFIEGRSFTASGGRISYVKAKDQLILEGDGRNNATLTHHIQPGQVPPSLKAAKMQFWPSTGQFQIIDLGHSEAFVGQLPGADEKKLDRK